MDPGGAVPCPVMDGFVAPVEEVRRAGEAAGRVGAAVRSVELGPVARTLAAALPGGAVARAGGEIERRWTGLVTSSADRMRAQADGLNRTAEDYLATDGRVAHGLAVR